MADDMKTGSEQITNPAEMSPNERVNLIMKILLDNQMDHYQIFGYNAIHTVYDGSLDLTIAPASEFLNSVYDHNCGIMDEHKSVASQIASAMVNGSIVNTSRSFGQDAHDRFTDYKKAAADNKLVEKIWDTLDNNADIYREVYMITPYRCYEVYLEEVPVFEYFLNKNLELAYRARPITVVRFTLMCQAERQDIGRMYGSGIEFLTGRTLYPKHEKSYQMVTWERVSLQDGFEFVNNDNVKEVFEISEGQAEYEIKYAESLGAMFRICRDCGKVFYLIAAEIIWYERRGMELPKRCNHCRNVRKEAKRMAESEQT